jgi:hypothetical protein
MCEASQRTAKLTIDVKVERHVGWEGGLTRSMDVSFAVDQVQVNAPLSRDRAVSAVSRARWSCH